MTPLTFGSLFAGIGGIDLGLQSLGMVPRWHSEIEAGPCAVLAEQWPDVVNLGDIREVDWAGVEPVDVIAGGFPCQDISYAGRGVGLHGKRSGLWVEMASAIGVLRPQYVVVENVSALFRRGFGTVVGDLADLGYDTAWSRIRAADIAAPHKRERVFIVASHADDVRGHRGAGHGRLDAGRQQPTHGGHVAADPGGERRRQDARGIVRTQAQHAGRRADEVHVVGGAEQSGVQATDHVADPDGDRRQGRAQRDGEPVEPREQPPLGHDIVGLVADAADADVTGLQGPEPTQRRDVFAWGDYGPAIERWERANRPAPQPTDDKGRLAVPFVEWLMGFPDGWTNAAPSRSSALKALGNAVVPQCAALAWLVLLPELEAAQVEYEATA